jgi:hypothetical protein
MCDGTLAGMEEEQLLEELAVAATEAEAGRSKSWGSNML